MGRKSREKFKVKTTSDSTTTWHVFHITKIIKRQSLKRHLLELHAIFFILGEPNFCVDVMCMCLCVVHWIEQKNNYGCPLNVCPIAYENWPKFSYCFCTCWIQGKMSIKKVWFRKFKPKKCKRKKSWNSKNKNYGVSWKN